MEDFASPSTSSNNDQAQHHYNTHATNQAEVSFPIEDINENRRRCLTLQLPINESWLGALHDVMHEVKEIFVDMLDTFRQPLMNSTTLMSTSILLLLCDRLLVSISGMVDTLLLTAAKSAANTAIPISSQTTSSMDTDPAFQKKLQDMARLFLTSSIGFFLHESDYSHKPVGSLAVTSDSTTCIASGDDCGDHDTMAASAMAGHVLLLATALAFMANTSYSSMLMTPLYSRIMDATTSTSVPTEFLLGMLLFLFGIEILAVLVFFILGYKVLLSSSAATEAIASSGNDYGGGFGLLILDNNGHGDNVVANAGQRFELDATGTTINLLLFLSTVIWIFCAFTSTIVRLALYHSMGE
ncbi:MAG: hypothetical protein SGILL_006680 [Bacillariaceae sp.]